jgi:hypothetical protein
MHTPASHATLAEYFRLGLQVGLLKPEDANAWAMSIVEKMAEPPYEVIEVALGKGVQKTLENLAAIQGERDSALAGRWLLGRLGQSLPEPADQLQWVTRRAMLIARIAGLDDDTYYRLDAIDDELFLARDNTYGSVAECRSELAARLREFPQPPAP